MVKKFDFIGTYSNKEFHFLNPSPEEVEIGDIANALSNLCRYSGHVSNFYSVAEHCVIMADWVLSKGLEPETALCALMHDASEAYLVDIPRPIKPYLEGYLEMEEKIQEVIFTKYGVPIMCDVVTWLDTNIVRDEASVLFNIIPAWVAYYEEVGIVVHNWTPNEARLHFSVMFDRLNSMIKEKNSEK